MSAPRRFTPAGDADVALAYAKGARVPDMAAAYQCSTAAIRAAVERANGGKAPLLTDPVAIVAKVDAGEPAALPRKLRPSEVVVVLDALRTLMRRDDLTLTAAARLLGMKAARAQWLVAGGKLPTTASARERAAKEASAAGRAVKESNFAARLAGIMPEMLRLKRTGSTVREIARQVGISRETVGRQLRAQGVSTAKPARVVKAQPAPVAKPAPILRPVQPIRTAPLDFRAERPAIVDDAATCDAALAARMDSARAMLRRGVEPGTVAMRAKVALRVAYQIAGEIRREARA